MTLTLKYALFRKNNPTTGRLVELFIILVAFTSLGTLLTAEHLVLTLSALTISLGCFGALSFFRAAEKVRHTSCKEQHQ